MTATDGIVGMFVCEFICAIIGVADGSPAAVKGQISLICIYIFFFASTWGPGAWVVSLAFWSREVTGSDIPGYR
jgi:hypothetical protein